MRALKVTCAGVIAAIATIAAVLPASAATTHATASQPQHAPAVQRGGMYYDPPVAILGGAASGQVRVLLTNGVKIPVPATEKSLIMQAILRSRSHGHITEDARYHQYKDTVGGNCGSSFIEIADKKPGNRPLRMTTGFHVNAGRGGSGGVGGAVGPASCRGAGAGPGCGSRSTGGCRRRTGRIR